jgi:hypothetical protein
MDNIFREDGNAPYRYIGGLDVIRGRRHRFRGAD